MSAAPLLMTRIATAADLEALVSLSCRLSCEAEGIPAVSASFITAATSSIRAALESPECKIWLVESVAGKPEPVATLRAELRTSPGAPAPIGFLCDVYVHPPWRRKGIGRRLIENAREFFTRHDVQEIRLETQLGHEAAERYWAAAGFHPFRTVWRRAL